ncbi:GDPmannose 4,6-dehydratase [Thermanaeromonas toyohensis ToBE]|uniref:GDPmannose 4,6-dehydratase n=1 Tax=Thermanaeromonas toyohensis ToBE TaxID=698762 RepID=A0A1W1VY03_9FIRM|nr:GDP-mannose 4,6-dehydratase [Thermanaeromonas toyohensis]SMB98235.1 GDPmannose 4,6-dehydratase [Thermanaeromonas toyohensis ToBE]
MRALVTGAAGFVGHYLVKFLLEKGYTVCATYHRQKPQDPLFQKTDIKRVDITDKEALRSLIYEFVPDEIYHLAGLAVTIGEKPAEYYRVNFYGTLNLFEAVREAAPQARVLYVGSAAAYGPVPPEKQPIREEMPLMPINHYAASKAAAEMAACAYAAQGLHIVRARPFNHTGPGQTTDYVCSRLAKQVAEVALGRTEPVITAGNLDAARDFTDVRDVVRAYWLLLQKGRPGEAYNVCSGRAYTVREIATLLAEVAGVKVELCSDPGLQRKTDISILLGSIAKVYRETGWTPDIPFHQTLTDVLLWWQETLVQVKKPSN